VALLVAERVRTLAFAVNVDATALQRALRRLLAQDDFDRAAALVKAARPAWAAECVLPLIDPELDESERSFALEERLLDTRDAATRGMRALRAAATMGSALGFIGAAVQIWWIFNGEHGLAALQAGNVESEALAKAVTSIAIGLATSSLALGSWTVLRKAARDRLAQSRRIVAAVEGMLRPDAGEDE